MIYLVDIPNPAVTAVCAARVLQSLSKQHLNLSNNFYSIYQIISIQFIQPEQPPIPTPDTLGPLSDAT